LSESASTSRQFPNKADEAGCSGSIALGASWQNHPTAMARDRIAAVIARPSSLFLPMEDASLQSRSLVRSGSACLSWVQGARLLSVPVLVILGLVPQKRGDGLNARRKILTLEIAILSERKLRGRECFLLKPERI
jgi:hypothetical protein